MLPAEVSPRHWQFRGALPAYSRQAHGGSHARSPCRRANPRPRSSPRALRGRTAISAASRPTRTTWHSLRSGSLTQIDVWDRREKSPRGGASSGRSTRSRHASPWTDRCAWGSNRGPCRPRLPRFHCEPGPRPRPEDTKRDRSLGVRTCAPAASGGCRAHVEARVGARARRRDPHPRRHPPPRRAPHDGTTRAGRSATLVRVSYDLSSDPAPADLRRTCAAAARWAAPGRRQGAGQEHVHELHRRGRLAGRLRVGGAAAWSRRGPQRRRPAHGRGRQRARLARSGERALFVDALTTILDPALPLPSAVGG